MPAAWQKWMPIYIQRLKSNPYVIAMHPAAVTGYLWLVMEQWQSDDCTLPNDIKALKIISGLGLYWADYAGEILDRFKEMDGERLRNDFCYELWMEAKARYEEGQLQYEALREAKIKAGKIGNDKRWGAKANRTGIAEPSQPVARAIKCDPTAIANDRLTDTYTETNTEEQKLKASPLSHKSDETRPAEYANAWNRLRGALPKVKQFTESRRKKIQARQRQGISLEEFEKAVKVCAQTPFLLGESKQRWKADFDWLIDNDTNIVRVLEGKYNAGESNGSVQKSRTGLEPGDAEEVIEIFRRIQTGEAYAGDGKPVHRTTPGV